MKASGIVRRIDDLGRIVIPKEIRKNLRLSEGCPMEIIPTQEGILLKKYYPETSLLDLLSATAKEVEEICVDLGPEKTGYIRKRIRDIQLLLKEENHDT